MRHLGTWSLRHLGICALRHSGTWTLEALKALHVVDSSKTFIHGSNEENGLENVRSIFEEKYQKLFSEIPSVITDVMMKIKCKEKIC